jgi:hypothetical protein
MTCAGQQPTTKGFRINVDPISGGSGNMMWGFSVKEDTICLPMSVAKKIMTAAEQKKVLEERISLLNEDIRLLGERIDNLKANESLSTQIIGTYTDQIKTMQDQRKLFEIELAAANKALRKEKRKTKGVAFLGIFITGIMGYLYITK